MHNYVCLSIPLPYPLSAGLVSTTSIFAFKWQLPVKRQVEKELGGPYDINVSLLAMAQTKHATQL